MAVFLKHSNARAGKLVGVLTIVVGLFALGDGLIAAAGVLMIAGAVLYRLESGYNSAPVAFGVRVLFFVMVAIGLSLI